MGRPLNKKFFGDTANAGYQVSCNAYVSASNKASYILEQRSNTKYRVTDLATDTDTGICKLVDATPSAIGEMQVVVTPENAETPRQATIAITAAGGTGALLTVTIVDAGYGYWAPATGDSQAGGDGTIDYTVSNGSLATVVINNAGSANTDGTVNIGDTPAANPPTENARIINAHTVKTFGGNTYAWPVVAPLGGRPGRGSSAFTEAEIGT